MKSLKIAPIVLALAAGLVLSSPAVTHAQSASAQPKLFDPKDAVIILLDHQTGLFQTIKYSDFAPHYRAAIESYQKAQEAVRLSSGRSAPGGTRAEEGQTFEIEGLLFRIDPVTGNTVLVVD